MVGEIKIPETGLSLLNTIRNPRERAGGLIDGYVPLSYINTEEVAVDKKHVEALATSMKLESVRGVRTGQISSVTLGMVRNFPKFTIIDGFHRLEALTFLGSDEAYATVIPNTTGEEVADLRITAASTHQSVRFARIKPWIEQSWSYSPWADSVTISQTLAMMASRGSGAGLGLSPEETEKLRDWIRDKCKQWHIAPGTLYKHFLTAQYAAPDLVNAARERPGGRVLDAITPRHLEVITLVFPNKHDLQRVVADTAVNEGLTVRDTRLLAEAISRVETPEEIDAMISSGSWRRLGGGNIPSVNFPSGQPFSMDTEKPLAIEKVVSPVPTAVEAGRIENDAPERVVSYKDLLHQNFHAQVYISNLLIHQSIGTTAEKNRRPFSRISAGSSSEVQAIMIHVPSFKQALMAELSISEAQLNHALSEIEAMMIEESGKKRLSFTTRDELYNYLRAHVSEKIVSIPSHESIDSPYSEEMALCVASLPAHLRQPFILSNHFGYPPEKVAEILKRDSVIVQKQIREAKTIFENRFQ